MSAASDTCLACYQDFRKDEEVMTCVECCQCFHIGKCAGITERVYKTKDEETKKKLKCTACRNGQTSSVNKKLAEISKNLAALTINVEELSALKQTVASIEHSVQHISDSHDKLLEASVRHGKEIEQLKKRVENVENSQDKQQVLKLTQELNELQQYSRRLNMEVHGLPFAEGEDLLTKLQDLAQRLNLPALSNSDIENLHRLPPRPNKIPATLIKFSRKSVKTAWLAKRGKLREHDMDIKFFDNLTALNKKLMWLAKSKARELNYRFVWSSDGKVFVRKEPNARAIRIASEDDIDKIV